MQTIVQDTPEEEIKTEVAQLLEQIFTLAVGERKLNNGEQDSTILSMPDLSLAPTANCEEKQVILNVEWRGARYTLVRTQQLAPEMVEFELSEEEERIHLSPREQEIVRLVAKGYPNKTIAGILEISQWTVSTHLRRIFAKLGVNSRAEMVATALSTGLAPVGEQ